MTLKLLIIIAVAALAGFAIGLLLGAAIGGGARADQEFQEYVQKNDSEI